jgi:hypothetical protein
MSGTRQWSLLIGGLLRAADMPQLESQVVPRAEEINAAVQVILNPQVIVIGGDPDASVTLGLGGNADYEWPTPRRYLVVAPHDISASQLYEGLVTAVLDVAPLPSGIKSNWTVRIAMDDHAGARVADRTFEIPQGGGRRSLLLRRTTLSGALGGGLLGSGFGPIGAAGGMIIGGAAGYLMERRLQEANDKQRA